MSDEQRKPGTGAGLGPTTSDAVRALMGKAATAIVGEKALRKFQAGRCKAGAGGLSKWQRPSPPQQLAAPRAVAAKAKPSLAASKTMKVV